MGSGRARERVSESTGGGGCAEQEEGVKTARQVVDEAFRAQRFLIHL